MTAPQNPRVTQADEAFARKVADDFLRDMDTPSLSARHISIMAAVKNGIHHARTQAEAEAKAREAALESLLREAAMGLACLLFKPLDTDIAQAAPLVARINAALTKEPDA